MKITVKAFRTVDVEDHEETTLTFEPTTKEELTDLLEWLNGVVKIRLLGTKGLTVKKSLF